MNLEEDITKEDLKDLLLYFSKQTYSASGCDEQAERILDRCIDLFLQDYDLSVLTNRNGELCGHYPEKIIIVESELLSEQFLSDTRARLNDVAQLKPLIAKARLARCRSRFVVPVISFEGKNICRSATLSSFAEVVGRSGFNFLFSSPVFPEDELSLESDNEWDLLNKSRIQDIQLLKALRVKYIFDLMLEKKKVKYGMRVTSSEKVDKENRYSEFCICCVPYPGCEFFRVLKSKDHDVSQRVYFDWNQDYVDADLSIPTEIDMQIDVNWERYQRWDLATLTQNYLLILLKTIVNSDEGVLVHCISGWDRTPLFISLLRLSLWADGKVHQSLNALEILYLTIAYDWLLFGHDLNDRMQRDEEVFFFCFHFLQYIMSDVYATSELSRSDISEHDNNETYIQRECSEDQDSTPEESLHSYRNGNSLSGSPCSGSINADNHQENLVVDHQSCSSTSRNQVVHCTDENGAAPLPVPQHNTMSKQSPITGSWQMVSNAGSCCSTGSAYLHPNFSKLVEEQGNSLSSCEEVVEESLRRVRLETVRNTFLTVYRDTLGNETQSNNATFSKLFDQVTDKLKNHWGK